MVHYLNKKEIHNDIVSKNQWLAPTTQGKGMEAPEFGLILGSGLGELAEEIEESVTWPFCSEIQTVVSTVVGHAGKLVYGDLAGRKVWPFKDVSISTKETHRGDFPSSCYGFGL